VSGRQDPPESCCLPPTQPFIPLTWIRQDPHLICILGLVDLDLDPLIRIYGPGSVRNIYGSGLLPI
jgi:hypothetical protein